MFGNYKFQRADTEKTSKQLGLKKTITLTSDLDEMFNEDHEDEKLLKQLKQQLVLDKNLVVNFDEIIKKGELDKKVDAGIDQIIDEQQTKRQNTQKFVEMAIQKMNSKTKEDFAKLEENDKEEQPRHCP